MVLSGLFLEFWKKKEKKKNQKNLQDKENLRFSAMYILDTEQCLGANSGHKVDDLFPIT